MGRALIGVGHDLSPHYSPRRGLNTGVVLYSLEAMRASREYNSALEPDRVAGLLHRAGISPSLAEQVGFQLRTI